MNKIEFGRLLKKNRIDGDLSLSKLAKEIKTITDAVISVGTISKWENGVHRPRTIFIEALAEIYNVDKNTLLKEAGYVLSAEPIESPNLKNDSKIKEQVIVDRLDKHWKEMTEIAALLAVSKYDESEDLLDIGELQDQFDMGIEAIIERYGVMMYDCFEAHIKDELNGGDFWSDLYKVVDFFHILVKRGTFKGKCPICKDWPD
jgi:transcriptional regulator with XRE-family HTH domain